MKKLIDEFFEFLSLIEKDLGDEWPSELPPRSTSKTEEFWMQVCKFEMSTRDSVSEIVQTLLDGSFPSSLTPIQEWMLRRRIEWASQEMLRILERGDTPPSLGHLIHYTLIASWESHGCQSLWQHAERGGEILPEHQKWLD